MSESDLSLADDESSFHESDYSVSSVEEHPTDEIFDERSKVQKCKPEVVCRQSPAKFFTRKIDRISLSLSGSSSGGSPWVDDTGSSSSTSSNASRSRIILSIEEQIRFDEARARLKKAQKRPRSVEKRRMEASDATSSVCTGKHPLKPIDVTGAQEIEKLQRTRPNSEDSTNSSSKKAKEIVKIKNNVPKPRILGVLPSIDEGQHLKIQDRYRNTKSASRPVPPIVIPEFCSPTDDLSSLGVTFSHSKAKQSNYRHRFAYDDNYDLENGNTIGKDEGNSRISVGWIEQRTNLELCLLLSVASSAVALLALLTIIFAS